MFAILRHPSESIGGYTKSPVTAVSPTVTVVPLVVPLVAVVPLAAESLVTPERVRGAAAWRQGMDSAV